MHFLHKPCQECRKPMNGGVYRAAHVCPHCGFKHGSGKPKRGMVSLAASNPSIKTPTGNRPKVASAKVTVNPLQPAEVKLLSKPVAEEQWIAANLGELLCEGVADLTLTPDMFDNGRFVGPKHKNVESVFNQAKKEALSQLRRQAAIQGANTVADIKIKYSLKNRESKNASLVVKASGDALVLAENTESA